MGTAICFKCGSEKSSALLACDACGATPRTENEMIASLVLSEYLSTKPQLADYSNKIRNHLKIPAPPNVVAQAQAVLKDSQLIAMFGAWVASSAPAKPIPAPAPSRPTVTPPAQPVRSAAPAQPIRSAAPAQAPARRVLKSTVLHETPFAILGVTSRDNRRRIVELAEEKSLELDQDVCQKARADLTNPRTRLSAEMAWLPGVSPRRASQLLEDLLYDPMEVRNEFRLPALAGLNLRAAAFEGVSGEHDVKDLARFIADLAFRAEEIDVEKVLRDINEDRAVSGFPEVRIEQIEDELVERKRYYLSAIKDALNRLPPQKLVQVMTEAVLEGTYHGSAQAPELIDDLVNSYEVETLDFLQKEAENVHKLIQAIRDAASMGETAVQPYLNKLVAVARNWDNVAQPIQLSAEVRGIDHEASIALAYEIRSLAIDLFNTYDMLAQSQQLTDLLRDLFKELPEVSERLGHDADELAAIFQERQEAIERNEEWAREIAFQAEIGPYNDTLSISSDGISWKGQNFPLDSITRLRWGGVRHHFNNAPMGTIYTIAFGDDYSEAVVEFSNEDIYHTLLEKLWQAVCVRLICEMLAALSNGQDLQFGDALIHDDGVSLVSRRYNDYGQKVRCSWDQVLISSANGSFLIWSKENKKIDVDLPYLQVANTHILEQIIRKALNRPGLRLLSELLFQEAD